EMINSRLRTCRCSGSIAPEWRKRQTDRAGLSLGDSVMKKVLLPLLCILLLAAAALAQANKPLLMRDPALSKTHIVFSYAGDLWTVSREGGDAARLTNGIGNEYAPIFSPDGRWIAFTVAYHGNID